MKSSSDLEILTCFYQTSNSIKAYSYKIDTNNEILSIYSEKSYGMRFRRSGAKHGRKAFWNCTEFIQRNA